MYIDVMHDYIHKKRGKVGKVRGSAPDDFMLLPCIHARPFSIHACPHKLFKNIHLMISVSMQTLTVIVQKHGL